jgi:hypothetical protein
MTSLTQSDAADLSKFKKRLVLAKIPYSDDQVLWPCLMFENRKELDENLDHLQLFDDNDGSYPGIPLDRVYKGAAATEFAMHSLSLSRAANREDPHASSIISTTTTKSQETVFLLLGNKETPTNTRFVFGDHETLPYNTIDQVMLFNLRIKQPGLYLAHKHASNILGEDEEECQRELPAELSSARFCFVEIEGVLWPATFLHDCNSLCDKLKSEGIIKSSGEAELFSANILNASNGPRQFNRPRGHFHPFSSFLESHPFLLGDGSFPNPLSTPVFIHMQRKLQKLMSTITILGFEKLMTKLYPLYSQLRPSHRPL